MEIFDGIFLFLINTMGLAYPGCIITIEKLVFEKRKNLHYIPAK